VPALDQLSADLKRGPERSTWRKVFVDRDSH
jgi:hypothetical protein